MDSACDFDLLGESVPQVRVSARTLALLEFFFNLSFILTPFFLLLYTSCLSSLEGGALNRLTGCPLESGGQCQNAPWREVRQEHV